MKYLIGFLILLSLTAFSEEGHDDHDEASSSVGPDKGVVENGPLGFKLSEEATKYFGYTTAKFESNSINLPVTALVKIKDEASIFRLRDGWLKRIEIQIIQKNSSQMVIKSSELKSGDSIVTSAVGFLRTAEIIIKEGATHSH